MPTKRTRKVRILIPQQLPEDVAAHFSDGKRLYFRWEDELAAFWKEARESFLNDWIRDQPGTRPWYWWKHESPEPRKRLGGVGDPAHEKLAVIANYDFGIPQSWVEQWMVDYYNGRGRDIHGNPIGQKYHEGDFSGVGFDPKNPPTFESEAAYLKRLNLFYPGEEARLSKSAYRPEKMAADESEDDL